MLAKDSDSDSASLFASDGDGLRSTIGKAYKDKKAESLPDTAKIEYSSEVPDDGAVAIATDGAGALVSASLDEVEKVTPTAAGAEVNTEGAVKALSGVDSSTKGSARRTASSCCSPCRRSAVMRRCPARVHAGPDRSE